MFLLGPLDPNNEGTVLRNVDTLLTGNKASISCFTVNSTVWKQNVPVVCVWGKGGVGTKRKCIFSWLRHKVGRSCSGS